MIVGYAARLLDRGYHHDGAGHPWIWLLVGLALAVIVALILVLLLGSRPTHDEALSTDPAMETLRMRFAQGEIDADEYTARAAQLSGVSPPAPQPPGPPPA